MIQALAVRQVKAGSCGAAAARSPKASLELSERQSKTARHGLKGTSRPRLSRRQTPVNISRMNTRLTLVFATILAFVGAADVSSPSSAAAPCRDRLGQPIKCVRPMVLKYCRDTYTKEFARCGGPHVERVPPPGH